MTGEASVPDGSWFQERAEAIGDVFLLLRVRPDLSVEYVSPTIESVLGHTPAEFRDDPGLLVRMVAAQDSAVFQDVLAMAPGQTRNPDLRWVDPSGDDVHTLCVLSSREREDGSVVIEGTLRDITARRRAEAALLESEERHRLLVENAWDVIWTMGLDGSITYVSPAIERVRGITPAEAMVQPLDQIHPPESAARVGEYFGRLYEAIAAGTEPPTFRGEQEYYRKDGSIMHGELQVIPHVDTEGRVVEILGVTRDISERKEFEEQLSRFALTDPLTGIWNRRHGETLIVGDMYDAKRYGPALSMLMIDVDHFKSVNDQYGHQMGDYVLIEVTRRLTRALRVSDVLARWGGEEFVLLLRFCSEDEAVLQADRLRRLISDQPFADVGTVTVSMGVAQMRDDDDLKSWMARADRSLYEAKAAGRNTVRPAPATTA